MSIHPLTAAAGVFAAEQLVRHVARPLAAGAAFAQVLLGGSPTVQASQPTDRASVTSTTTYQFPLHPASMPPAGLAVEGAVNDDARLQRRLSDFFTLLKDRMTAAGLEPGATLRIRSDVFGGLDRVEDHPQASQIEDLIARDPALSQAWNQLVQLLSRRHARAMGSSPDTAATGAPANLGSADPLAQDSPPAIVEVAIDQQGFTATVEP